MSRVLVLLKVSIDLRKRNRGWAGEGRLWDLRCEIVEELGEKGKCRSDRVLLVGNNDGYSRNQSSSFVLGNGEERLTCKLLRTSPVVYVRSILVLLDTLTCTLRRAFGDRLGEKRQEFADGTLLIEGKGGKVRCLA